MELRQLIYFAKIVEEGSISAAARALYMTQPPMSLQIKHLEEELQTPLFERRGQRLVVTEAGEALYQRAADILRLVEVAKHDVHTIARGAKDTLRLGIASSACSTYVRQLLRQFHLLHPQLAYDLREESSYSLADMLAKDQLDLALVRTPLPQLAARQLSLQEDTLSAVGPIDILGEDPSVSLESLSRMPLLIYRRWEGILQEVFEQQGLSLAPLMTADDARTCLSWASSGFGVALIPRFTWESLPSPSLVCREIGSIPIRSSVVLLINENSLSRPAQELFEFCRSYVAAAPFCSNDAPTDPHTAAPLSL